MYEATDRKIKFLVGDIFDCTPEVVGVFDVMWDAKPPVALNLEDHEKYVKTLAALTKPGGRMLMVVYEYTQSLCCLFPYSMPPLKVRELYHSYYNIQFQERENLLGKMAKKAKLHTGFARWGHRVVYLIERKQQLLHKHKTEIIVLPE